MVECLVMICSFVVYIDESGDQGFTFRTPSPAGSSHWFILGALVVRDKNDLQCVEAMRNVRNALGRPALAHIHWRKLKHHDKVFYAQALAKLPARLIAACVHKPSIRDRTTFQQKDVLYFYAVRYLLERVSWLARDAAVAGEGDGRARLVFSERTHMSYADLLSYLTRLKHSQLAGEDVRIHFPSLCLESDKVTVLQPQKRAGLQLGDAWTGAAWNSLEEDKYGNREPRYARILCPLLYRHSGSSEGYGLKLIPKEGVTFVESEIAAGRIEPWWRQS